MLTLTLQELKNKLDDGYSFTLINKENTIELSPAYTLYLDIKRQRSEIVRGGYEIVIAFDNQTLLQKSYKRFSSIVKRLQESNAMQDKSVKIHFINRTFTSFEEVEKQREFDQIKMPELLKKYEDCDEFSLTTYYGENGLTATECERIYKAEEEKTKARLFALYQNNQAEIQIPFETLFADIFAECKAFDNAKNRKKYKEMFQNSFICDDVGQSTRYEKPLAFFWHAYHALGMLLDIKASLLSRTNLPKNDNLSALNEQKYALLKPHVTRCELAHENHCTQTGSSLLTYYFALNEQTKAWLLQFEDDYAFDGLEDLAFYKGRKLQFSSCTHEGFHSDLSK